MADGFGAARGGYEETCAHEYGDPYGLDTRRFRFYLRTADFFGGAVFFRGAPLLNRWIEGIFDDLACVESHSLAGCDLDGLAGLWIPPVCVQAAPPH
jgi:hypothetical protein